MAILNSNWGVFRGRFGKGVLRDTEFGNTVSALPSSFSVPQDAASISRRTKFKLVIKMSAAILKLLSLKVLWERTAPHKGRCLNKIFQKNYKRVSHTTMDISKAVLSAEDPQFVITNPEVNITPTGITAIVGALANQGITASEVKIKAEGIILLSGSLDESLPEFYFMPVSSPDQALITNDSLTFTLPLAGADAIIAQQYTVKSAVLTLVTTDADGNPVKTSTTFGN